MPSTNHIKIGGSDKLSLSKGNLTVGVKGTTEYGPTSISGFYNGITPPVGGYTIYVEKASQGPSIHIANDDNHCINKLKDMGAPGTTIGDVLTWALTQNNIIVLKSELTNSLQTNPFQNVAGTNNATGFFFGGFRNDGLLDFVKVGFLANGTGVTNAPVTAIDRDNQTITISGAQFVSGDFYTFSLDTTLPGGSTPTPTPIPATSTPTPTPEATATPTPTPTPEATATPTPTPTPSPEPARYYYGTTEAEAGAMISGVTNFSFGGGSDMCYQYGASFYGDEMTGLTSAVTYYLYDSVSGATRSFTITGPGSTGANLSGACSYQYARYRAAQSFNGVCDNFTGFTATFTDTNLNSSDFCNGSLFQSYQLTGLTSGSFYVYDTVTDYTRTINNGYSGATTFYLTGSCVTNDCIRYVYADTEIGTCTSTSGLTNVNFDSFCGQGGGAIYANEFSGLTFGTYYVRDKYTEYVRMISLTAPDYAILTGETCTTPCVTGRTGYYIGTTAADAYTGGTETFNVGFSPTGYTLCNAGTLTGATGLSSLAAGTYYLYDVTENKVRDFTIYSSGSTNASLGGACTTPSNAARPGYYYSTTSADAVTGGTQVTGVTFGYSTGDTMCNPSVISISAGQFSSLSAGSYFIYDGDANKVRAFSLYGGSSSGSMSGSCSTPLGGARAGYWYASTRPAAITGGTQVNDVTFSGGSNTLCTASTAFSTSFSSLSGYIYIYNGDTGDVRTFYGTNNSSISSMSTCLNTTTPVYYYSTMSNDCYGNNELTNVTFNGGADFCSASGFSSSNLSSLGPNTYYMRDPFTDNFRSFYAAYNGSVSFTNSCSQYSCQ
jgi:hypothetical protein